MLDEHVPFLERSFVEEDLQPFACRQLALGVLGFDATLTAPGTRGGALL
jgi:hypothetical protein